MSLILDALKRSGQADSPISHAPTDAYQSTGTMRLPPVLAALLLGALLGAGVVTWFLLVSPDNAASSDPLASAARPMAADRAGSSAAADPPVRLNQSSADRVGGSQPDLTVLSDPLRRAGTAGPLGVSSSSPPVDTGSTETARAVAELNAQMWSDSESATAESSEGAPDKPSDKPSDRVASEPETPQLTETRSLPSEVADLVLIPPPIDLEQAIAEASAALGEQSLVPHAATMIENLSQQQKDDIPTLIYSVHDFQTDGSATVELNGQRLKVGQRAGQVVVRDILVDSVILENSGVIFRLTALNSWVNM